MKEYVTTQLLNLSEADHKFREKILSFLIEDPSTLNYLASQILGGNT